MAIHGLGVPNYLPTRMILQVLSTMSDSSQFGGLVNHHFKSKGNMFGTCDKPSKNQIKVINHIRVRVVKGNIETLIYSGPHEICQKVSLIYE